MENGFWHKLLDSIAAENTYILIWAIIMALICIGLFLCARKLQPPETKKYYIVLRIFYEVFQTGISIFPLLGMFGTVKALLSMDFTNDLAGAQLRFFDALTSTAWGIIFAVVFKIINARFFADVEDLIQRHLSLIKKLRKSGIDESQKQSRL